MVRTILTYQTYPNQWIGLIRRLPRSACVIISGVRIEIILYHYRLAYTSEVWRLGGGVFGRLVNGMHRALVMLEYLDKLMLWTKRYDFSIKFKASISKTEEWRKGAARRLSRNLRQWIQIGGSRWYLFEINRNTNFNEATRSLQRLPGEVLAIQAVVKIIVGKNIHERRITILS